VIFSKLRPLNDVCDLPPMVSLVQVYVPCNLKPEALSNRLSVGKLFLNEITGPLLSHSSK